MLRRLFHLTLIATAAAPACAFGSPDRHPGIYEFQRLPPGYCANPENQRSLPQQQGPLLHDLGDLPAAWVIRIDAPVAQAPPPGAFGVTRRPSGGALPYNPCATTTPALVRVR
jgi:hypothetical protein